MYVNVLLCIIMTFDCPNVHITYTLMMLPIYIICRVVKKINNSVIIMGVNMQFL